VANRLPFPKKKLLICDLEKEKRLGIFIVCIHFSFFEICCIICLRQ
jgi:hypothetical protein